MKYIKILLILLLIVACQPSNREEEIPEEKEETIQKISFVAVGDNIMHDNLLSEAKDGDSYDFSSFYDNIKNDIKNADISFINQETILGGSSYGYKGYPEFNTPDEMASTLYDLGFDVVNGATNHAADCGDKAIKHSIDVFNQYDMEYIGLYKNQNDKSDIPVIEKNGIKVSFLSYTIDMNISKSTNLCKYFDKETIKTDVAKAKEISDIVIASCHWGVECSSQLNSIQTEYAQYLANQGVDVIIGTHPHVLQETKWIDGKNGHKTLVSYSLGNFLSGMLEEETQLEGMLSFDIVKKDNDISIYNVTMTPLVNHYQTNSIKNIHNARYNFSVYKLKDYTDDLASKHGLNGYNGINISIDKMKEMVRNVVSDDINIDMGE